MKKSLSMLLLTTIVLGGTVSTSILSAKAASVTDHTMKTQAMSLNNEGKIQNRLIDTDLQPFSITKNDAFYNYYISSDPIADHVVNNSLSTNTTQIQFDAAITVSGATVDIGNPSFPGVIDSKPLNKGKINFNLKNKTLEPGLYQVRVVRTNAGKIQYDPLFWAFLQ